MCKPSHLAAATVCSIHKGQLVNPLLISPLLDIGKAIIAKVWPDPVQQAEAQLKLAQLQQTGELAELDAQLKVQLAQLDINKLDAQGNVFQRGWRPFIGWTGGIGLCYEFLMQPMLAWLCSNIGWQAPPHLDTVALFGLVSQLLGLATMRTIEKIKGKA